MNFNTLSNNTGRRFILPPKSMWTKEEDELLTKIVKELGARKWNTIAEHVPGRNGKQCRERWMSHISPDLINPTWTREEDEKLIKLHETFGNKWSKMSAFFPGRPPNAVKNRWNCILRKNKREQKAKITSPNETKEVTSFKLPSKEEEEVSSIFDIFSNNCDLITSLDAEIESGFFSW